MSTTEPTADEKHAALVGRVALAIERQAGVNDPEAAAAVLDLLAEEGRLIDPGELQSSVGAVFQLWQAAKAEVAQLREQRDAHLVICKGVES